MPKRRRPSTTTSSSTMQKTLLKVYIYRNDTHEIRLNLESFTDCKGSKSFPCLCVYVSVPHLQPALQALMAEAPPLHGLAQERNALCDENKQITTSHCKVIIKI